MSEKLNAELAGSSENPWDILKPENNGLGHFDRERAEASLTANSTSIEQTRPELEVEPIVIDGHRTSKEWDPDATAVITCNILDEHWAPDLDDARPEQMTYDERIKELTERLDFLDRLERHERNPDPAEEGYFHISDDALQAFRHDYLDALAYRDAHPDAPNAEIRVSNTRRFFTQARTRQFLASNPALRRSEIQFELGGLRQILAKSDERYSAAFTNVDQGEVTERMSQLVDNIPPRSLEKLAKIAKESPMTTEKFERNALMILVKALGLDEKGLEIQHIDSDTITSRYGQCAKVDSGQTEVVISMSHCAKPLDYAETLAHELLHAKQMQIRDEQPNTEQGEFYKYCYDFYAPPEYGYERYATQFIEAEAFAFGRQFSARLEELAPKPSLLQRLKAARSTKKGE